jgi:hypothetical protein
MSYGGNCATISVPSAKTPARITGDKNPDFTKMTTAEKVAYQKKRWDRILGE